MKKLLSLPLLALAIHAQPQIENPQINYAQFKEIVLRGEAARELNRLSEAAFLEALESGEYVLLDARSAANFKLRHVQGAVNLPFTEFAEETLREVIPSQDSKILIYCNNNFAGSPVSMMLKMAPASLNVHTQASLRAYGYENIFELGPYLNVNKTILPFAGTEVE
jgi:rhodanese-related sulfurtransferase